MAKKTPKVTKLGQSRLDVPVEKLLLDPENPRLRQQTQGKKQNELLKVLYREFNIAELADSLSQNGYFAEEPLVAVPKDLPSRLKNPTTEKLKGEFDKFINKKTTEFYVVEGNRRLATCKLLLDSEARSSLKIKSFEVELSVEVSESIKELPVIVYTNRDSVLTYLGVRHIMGIQKWNSYARATYVAKMVEDGRDLADIQQQMGDRKGAARKTYLCYRLIEEVEDQFDIDASKARNYFSYLVLSSGQGAIRDFLGIPRKWADVDFKHLVPKEKLDNLRDLFSWLFGEEDGRLPVIRESTDIASKLVSILGNGEATEHLRATRDLEGAYERSDGEEQMVIRYLSLANRTLEGACGLMKRHKTHSVLCEVEKCLRTVERLGKNASQLSVSDGT